MRGLLRLVFGGGGGIYLLLAAGVVCGGLYGYGRWVGYQNGYAASAARFEAATAALNKRLATEQAAHRLATANYLREREALADLVRGLEDEADLDPDAARPALGAASVRRLNSVR
jgi:hypothetical protein